MAKLTKKEARKRRHLKIRKTINGTRDIPRVNVFKSNTNFYAQIIDDNTKQVLISSSSLVLKLKNGGNIEAAIKVGIDLSKKAKKHKITKVVFDRSGYLYHGKVKSFADTLRKEGLKF